MARQREESDHELFRAEEFWQEEERSARREMGRQFARWLVLFVALFSFGCFVVWWAAQTVRYGAARSGTISAPPEWRIYGIVRDASTGEPVPFARIGDGPDARPPRFSSTADHLGHYELHTLPERHEVTVSAIGYRHRTIKVGREWYAWMPSGDERVDFHLTREEGR